MRRLKNWIINRFLPAYAKDTLLRENKELREELKRKGEELDRLNAYIDGLERGIRAQRRIVINNEVTK